MMKNVEEKAIKQDEFGFKKYGQYLDPMDKYDWLNMAEEEAVDMLKYFHAERERRDVILSDTLDIANRLLTDIETLKEFATLNENSYKAMKRDILALKDNTFRLSKNLEGKFGQTTEDKEINH